MNIQSLSLVVPTERCVNNCPFCVSKLHSNNYDNRFNNEMIYYSKQYIERLEYARDNGTDTIILTGTGEALQNKNFINKFSDWNNKLSRPFHIIELQTTGIYLNDDNNIKWLRNEIGVKTISLSVSNLFDDEKNNEIIGIKNEKLKINLYDLCHKITDIYDLNLRISLNMLNNLNDYTFDDIFNRLKELNVNQVTFRRMWKSDEKNEINKWIENNSYSEYKFNELQNYIKSKYKKIGILPHGAEQYSIDGISTVIDTDCMSDNISSKELKYLILRENAKLYSNWTDKASLIF